VSGLGKIVEHTDMLHFINMTNDGLVGLSTISYATQTLNIANETNLKAKDNLEKSLSGILVTDGVMSD
jgi:phage portal protein BeeE